MKQRLTSSFCRLFEINTPRRQRRRTMGDYIRTEMGFLGEAIVGLPYWQALMVLGAIILAGVVACAMC